MSIEDLDAGILGIRRHLMKFGAVTEVADDDAVWPFFVGQQAFRCHRTTGMANLFLS